MDMPAEIAGSDHCRLASRLDHRVGVCTGVEDLAVGAGVGVVRDGAAASMSRVTVKFRRTSLSR
jgi:hypothetical protein